MRVRSVQRRSEAGQQKMKLLIGGKNFKVRSRSSDDDAVSYFYGSLILLSTIHCNAASMRAIVEKTKIIECIFRV